ncbi:hypothetical protein [Parasitella parasitica]|uniref:Tc1-like transposase DDE domain-containing protein n=1 Tax=Parasitella parasitica TaxID=35722 RepID=A0A0B7NDZ9_9FUNG|nr:hypothetical protein [Parasitella parasitica]
MNNKLQLTLKRTTPLEVTQEVERTQRLRREYCENLQAEGVNHTDNCIFVDETGFNSCMVPGRARSKKNKGTTDRFIFGEFVAQLLKSLDEQYGRPMIVIMDNAKFHKSENVAEIFENSQHKAHFLPPYSPMFNPIESCFSKLKNHVKRSPRKGKAAMLNLIKEAGDTITAQDCNGWTRHCKENINKCMRGENVTFDCQDNAV